MTHMEGVDKLREWAHGFNGPWKRNEDALLKIADAIEAEVADRYVALPVDADGVPIRVGDWITGVWDAKAKVVAITSEAVYWWEPDGCHWCHAHEVRHHHVPTVEDVLREFVATLMERGELSNGGAQTIAEFAAKLRLAGEDE